MGKRMFPQECKGPEAMRECVERDEYVKIQVKPKSEASEGENNERIIQRS